MEASITEINNKLFNQIKEMLGGQLPKNIISLSVHLELDTPPFVECRYYIDNVSLIESFKKFKIIDYE